MINSGQIKTKYANKKNGTPVYGNLQVLITPEVPIQSGSIGFTLTADGNTQSLSGASVPTGNVYISGGNYEAINGGIIASTGTIGTHSTTTVLVGGRISNVSIVLSSEDDEVVNIVKSASGAVEKRRYVYGLWNTDLTDGDAVGDNKLQLCFVAWNDSTHALEAVTLKAGTYKTVANRCYNKGTLAEAKKDGTVLTAHSIGGYAEDELLDLAKDKPTIIEGTLTSEATLQSDKKVVITIGADASSSNLKDSASTAIPATMYQKETIIFASGDVGKTLYESVGGMVIFNDVMIKSSKVTIKTTGSIEIDLSANISTTLLYVDDYLAVTIKGK